MRAACNRNLVTPEGGALLPWFEFITETSNERQSLSPLPRGEGQTGSFRDHPDESDDLRNPANAVVVVQALTTTVHPVVRILTVPRASAHPPSARACSSLSSPATWKGAACA